MKAKKFYSPEEISRMLKATEGLLDVYYGCISASNHGSMGEVEEAGRIFDKTCRNYKTLVPETMQTNINKMRERVSKLQQMAL